MLLKVGKENLLKASISKNINILTQKEQNVKIKKCWVGFNKGLFFQALNDAKW